MQVLEAFIRLSITKALLDSTLTVPLNYSFAFMNKGCDRWGISTSMVVKFEVVKFDIAYRGRVSVSVVINTPIRFAI